MKILLENWRKYEQRILKEEEPEKSTGGAIDAKANLKSVDADTIVQGLLSGDENNPVKQGINGYNSKGKNAVEIKAWAEQIGPEKLVDRIKKVQELIPTEAPAKVEMPSLEPADAAKVKDALDDTGGEYGIDFNEPRFGQEVTERAIKPNFKDPRFPAGFTSGMPTDKGKDYLTRGLRDKKQGDDKITVSPNQSLNVGDMIPTQSNILFGKSLWFAINLVELGKLDELDGFATTKGEILDGHHRWSACYIAAGPNKGLTKVTFVDAAAEIAIPMLRSIGNAFGNEQKS